MKNEKCVDMDALVVAKFAYSHKVKQYFYQQRAISPEATS